jgi:hypothetical protein
MRDATVKNLRAEGYTTYAKLILRPESDLASPSVIPFKSGERRKLVRAGYDILVNVGDQDSDLAGGYADRSVKVPNPMYFIPEPNPPARRSSSHRLTGQSANEESPGWI